MKKDNQFIYDEKTKVYFKPGIDKFNYSDGIEKETYVHRVLQKVKDLGDDSEELMSHSRDWPSYYHLGIGRSAICKALTIFDNKKILEIGSGCGAITRYLAERALSVDCLEGSFRRASITSARCKDLNNVRVFSGNFNEFDLEEEYEIVTLIGVLEYAPLYSKTELSKTEACIELLKKASSKLKDNGNLVIAIENKYGLKYWSGCPEDHTGKIYDGINGYPKDKSPVTFSKNKIIELLKESGFQSYEFYYCFPDYKFAKTIISDTALNGYNLSGWIKSPFPSNGERRDYSFHEALTLNSLSEDALLDQFANSFLIVASANNQLQKPDWAVKSFSLNRKKSFRTVTTAYLNPKKYIEKKRIYPKNEAFATWEGKSVEHHEYNDSWFNGKLWSNDLLSSIWNKDYKKRILDLTKALNENLVSKFSKGETDNEGYPLINGTALDYIFSNIIVDRDNNKNFIDKEWVTNSPIAADFIIWRSLKYDLVEPCIPWLRKLKINHNKLVTEILRDLYPNYNKVRNLRNIQSEKLLQQAIGLNVYDTWSYSNRRFFGLERFAKLIWVKLPENLKNVIRKHFVN